jgi:hypothetical protein
VVVAPIAVPLPDGRVKLGAAAHPPSSGASSRALSANSKESASLVRSADPPMDRRSQ